MSDWTTFGRVDADGTVYVKTAEGERIVGSWQGGFQAEVTIMNHSTRTYGGWTASWAWPSGQSVAQVWNGTHTASGTNVTVRNATYNGALAPNGTTTFGMLGSHSGTNTPPSITCVGMAGVSVSATS